ncbi:hypothetical protein C8R43DRAFT_1088552 [Mycena crocata]|nr:hypothetical protein C8R43DRAFT_1088552 [Mycena crocata]
MHNGSGQGLAQRRASAAEPWMSASSSISQPPCVVKRSEGKGRGVFAARAIVSQTVVESSPVLLFNKEEYENHGRFTILDQYTFKWKNGNMALALGLGSLFNHSNHPNVSYTIDATSDCIHYTTTRDVEPEEELCIYYGSNLWFDPIATGANDLSFEERADDGWGGLSSLDIPQNSLPSFFDGSIDDVVPEEDLPFERFKPPPEEETADTIQTVQAWAVDVLKPQSIGPMLKWLRRSELDADELGHLKRVRKRDNKSTFLLTVAPVPPSLPQDLSISDPFLVTVPASVALTPTSLNLKSLLWPTIYAPRRKGEVEDWSQGKARWAWEAMHVVVQEALQWQNKGEVWFLVAEPFPLLILSPASHRRTVEGASTPSIFMAHDTRQTAAHPLRHAVMNVIRQISDQRARSGVEPADDSQRNGSNYLLTSSVLFTTHEPCIMCSMALLHSRVKEVVYLIPMEKTGGCGGAICLPTLPGVNHRFGICRWKGETIQEAELQLDASVDA